MKAQKAKKDFINQMVPAAARKEPFSSPPQLRAENFIVKSPRNHTVVTREYYPTNYAKINEQCRQLDVTFDSRNHLRQDSEAIISQEYSLDRGKLTC